MGWKIEETYRDHGQDPDRPDGALEVLVEGNSASDLITFSDEKDRGITMNINVLSSIVDDLEKIGALRHRQA